MSDATTQLPPSPADATRPHRGKINWWRWFWIATLVVSLPYAWYCFYVPANTITWAASYASAQEQAAQSDKPLLLFFTGKWCVPCRIMKRTVWADPQVSDLVNAEYIPVMIDVDDPDTAATRELFRVGATPSTVVADPQGNVLQKIEGGVGKAAFLDSLGRLNPSPTEDK